MSKYEIVEMSNPDGNIEQHVIIDRGNDEFTSMPKSVWDAQQAAKEASGTLS